MTTTNMTGINTVQHIVQNLNTPVRADEGNEDNLIDPKAVVELREIETRMVRQVYRERSVSLVAGSFFTSAKSEAGSGSREWNETNPDSPLNISSLFPSNKSETDDSSPEFSHSNSDSIMSIFLPATSPIDSPENYEIIVQSRSIPSYSIMSIFPPATSPVDSPENNVITLRSRSIPSYSIMSIFPPAMSEIDSPDNYEIIFRNPSIPSYYHCFPPDRSDTDSYGSSPPMQFSIPSLHFPSKKSETINSSLVINGISLEERILGGIEKMDKCIQAIDILQSNRVVDLMFIRTDDEEEIGFNRTLLNFSRAVALGGRSPENLFMILDAYDEMAEAMKLLAHDPKSNQARAMLTERETLIDLENKKQNAMQSGDIHPLTQTMMNCVKLIVDYSDTQNLLEIGEDDAQLDALRNHDSNSLKMNPLASQLLVLLNFLESNLEKESKLYGDGVLQYIFLMNNILYMNQKMKDWDLGGLLGDNWVRKQHVQIAQYAMSYLRASWTKVLAYLNDEGIGVSLSNATRVALKERFKNFNACFEEIYRVQTAWKVPDAQLREELRILISPKVILAYRSFVGRFGKRVESGWFVGKYIKYTADDLENYLFNLFEGVPRVLEKYMG